MKIKEMKQLKLWMLATILMLCGLSVLTSCTFEDVPVIVPEDEFEARLQQMTLREKVGQLFYIRPESLDPTIKGDFAAVSLQEVNSRMRIQNEHYPVGGIILYAHNIKDEEQLKQFILQIRSLKGAPLLCIDEEGGRVARIGRNSNFNVKTYESMGAIGATGDPFNAYECGNTIGTYLKRYGFDIDFAPVADVNTNPDNIVIGARAFSDDPLVAAPMVTSYLQGLKDAQTVSKGAKAFIRSFGKHGLLSCAKHFPGHGDTKADTHFGYASSKKTWAEMLSCEMVTFMAGINWGCKLIMTAHISAPNVTGSDIPSTMSSVILQDKLRGELGYQNIIVTDAMEMGAITQQYSNTEAAVGCIKAGVDIVLGPQNFTEAFDAVVAAVNNGTLSEERINQSVRRILKLKQSIR